MVTTGQSTDFDYMKLAGNCKECIVAWQWMFDLIENMTALTKGYISCQILYQIRYSYTGHLSAMNDFDFKWMEHVISIKNWNYYNNYQTIQISTADKM